VNGEHAIQSLIWDTKHRHTNTHCWPA